MTDIFISYAREDRGRVEPLVNLLQSQGFEVWWDRELLVGGTYEKDIDDAIRSAKCVIVIWSQKSVESEWVQAEAGDGLDRGILVPVLIDKVRIPLAYRRKQAATLFGFPRKRDVSELNRMMVACARLCEDGRRITKLRVPFHQRLQMYALPAVTALALSTAIIFGTLYLTRAPGESGNPNLPTASVYVTPFEMPEGREDPSGEIATSLTRIRSLHVTQDNPGITLPFHDPPARDMYTLTGRFEEGTLQVRLGGDRSWANDYAIRPGMESRVVRMIVSDLAKELELTVPGERPRAVVPGEAWSAYLKARNRMANMPSAESLVGIRAQLAGVVESARRFPGGHAAACQVDLALYKETSEMGYYESAERYCNRALTLDQQDPEVHVALGALYRASGQLELALSSLELAINLAPFSTAALRELALTLDKRGDLAAAESQLLKALEIEPNGWRNYHELGGLHFRAGNYPQAATYFDLEVALLNDEPRALSNLGAAHYLAEQFDDAIGAWQRLLDLRPDAVLYSNLGSAHFFRRDFAAAASMYREATQLNPNDHRYWGHLGDATLHSPGDHAPYYQKAIALARSALAIDPEAFGVWGNLASYYAGVGDPAAREAIEQALALRSDDVYLIYDAAVVMARLNEHKEAARLIEQLKAMGYSESLIASDANFDVALMHPANTNAEEL